MDPGENSLEQILSTFIRPDGTLRADLLCGVPSFGGAVAGEPTVVALCYLAFRDAMRVFLDPPGNVGEGHFLTAETALTFVRHYLKQSRTPNNKLCQDRILIAVDKTLDGVAFLREVQQKIDAVLSMSDPGAVMAEDVRRLVQQCSLACDDESRRSLACAFWFSWVTAWALCLHCVEENGIQELKMLYQQYPWLERRLGERQALRPPGGMADPDEQSEGEGVQLF